MFTDPAPRRPLTRGEKIAVAACIAVFSGLLLGELLSDYTPAKLGFVFMLAGWVPALILHEIGHAVAAWLVGWRVTEMVIGYGPELFRFRWGGTAVRVKALLIEGYVVPSPTGTQWNRLKSAWIYFGGPGTELLLALCLLHFGSAAPFGHAVTVSDVAVQGVAGSLLLGVLFTLVPYVPSPGQASDGLGIILSAFRSRESFSEHRSYPWLVQLRGALALEQNEQAERTLVEAREEIADDLRFGALQAVLLASRGEVERAYELLQEIGPPEKYPPATEAEMLHAAAWVVLISGDTGATILDAERACSRALSIVGDSAFFRTTLGALELAHGRHTQALETLMIAYKRARRREDELRVLAYLVIAANSTKDMDLANGFLGELRLDDLGPVLRRAVMDSCIESS